MFGVDADFFFSFQFSSIFGKTWNFSWKRQETQVLQNNVSAVFMFGCRDRDAQSRSPGKLAAPMGS